MRERGDFEKGIMKFGNGGDRVGGEVPSTEEDVCNTLGVDLVWGLGDKVQSSSWLLEKYNNIKYESRYKKFSRRNTKRFRVGCKSKKNILG